jgi:MoaA/NifB/PqqE/SkfB family radical SAM enzyme
MNSIITEENLASLNELVDIGAHLGIDCLAFDYLTFLTTSDYALHRETFSKLFTNDPFLSLVLVKDHKDPGCLEVEEALRRARRHAARKKLRIFLKPDLSKSERKKWFTEGFSLRRQCIYPWNVLRISPKGDVYPCAAYHIKMGNIKEAPLARIWNNKKFVDFRKLLLKNKCLPGCNRCVKL